MGRFKVWYYFKSLIERVDTPLAGYLKFQTFGKAFKYFLGRENKIMIEAANPKYQPGFLILKKF